MLETAETVSPPTPPTAHTSTRTIYVYCAGDFGLAWVWVVKFAITSPYFRTTLNATPLTSHIVWALGPLSGMLTAPVVGVLLDACTSRFGRRRPFIFAGMLAAIVGLQLFASAGSVTWHAYPITQAVFGFAVLDFATNVMMFPSRALLGDIVSSEQQHDVQSAAAVIASLAEICAGGYVYSWDAPVTHIKHIVNISCVVLAVTIGISLVMCKETPLDQGLDCPSSVADAARERDIELASIDSDASDRGDAALLNAPTAEHGISLLPAGADPVFSFEDLDAVDEDLSEASEAAAPLQISEDRAQDFPELSPDVPSPPACDRVIDQGRYAGRSRREGVWSPLSLLRATIASIVDFPPELWKVSIPLFLGWGCWFATLPNYSVWVGESVLGGNATGTLDEQSRYQKGVNVFAVATLSKSILSLLFSASYPFLVRTFGQHRNLDERTGVVSRRGEQLVYGVPFILFSLVLWSNAYTKCKTSATVVIASGAFSFICTQTIPTVILISSFPTNLAGKLGVLNLVVVTAQLIDTMYTGWVASAFSEAAVLRIGAVWALAAGLTAFACF